MSSAKAAFWYHSNRYSADSACEHCDGIIRHEGWCITHNRQVPYACQVVIDGEKISLGDKLILHALGVSWNARCSSQCRDLGISDRQ